jgi:hypothetical protein
LRQAAIRLRLLNVPIFGILTQYNTFSPEDFDIGKSFTLKLAGGGEKGVPKRVDALARK